MKQFILSEAGKENIVFLLRLYILQKGKLNTNKYQGKREKGRGFPDVKYVKKKDVMAEDREKLIAESLE